MPAATRRALLGELIDYAGLFPPAELDVDAAVAGYRAARESEHAWMLDRFVCPSSRVEDLRAARADDDDPWSLAVVLDDAALDDPPGLGAALSRLGAFSDAANRIDALEVRLPAGPPADEIASMIEALARTTRDAGLPRATRCFIELPLDDALAPCLDVLAREGLEAKVRCGGAAAAPNPDSLARFVVGCATRDLRWKATAGLHHPTRRVDAATRAAHHGFLNLLAAAGLAMAGAEHTEIAAALADGDAGALCLDDSGLVWRNRRIGAEARERFDGYGSCSFVEPVHDLVDLGALADAVASDG